MPPGGSSSRGKSPHTEGFGFQWHLTDRCNLRCAHCYQDTHVPGRELTLSQLRAAVQRVAGALPGHQLSINLTGGEPLLVPELPELLEHLEGIPNVTDVHIITNGTVTDERLLWALRDAAKLRLVKVSIESGIALVNDAIRGQGQLERTRANIERYQRMSKKDVALMMTLGSHNVDSIDETVSFAAEVAATGVIFERFVPLGRGVGMADQALGPRQWMGAVVAIGRAAGMDLDPTDLLAYHAFWLDTRKPHEPHLQGALCNLGDESMALMPDGTVFPCRRLPLAMGNLLCEPFAEILSRLFELRPSALRLRLKGDLCGLCGVEDCAGCRALARAVHGDMLLDDPRCPLRLE